MFSRCRVLAILSLSSLLASLSCSYASGKKGQGPRVAFHKTDGKVSVTIGKDPLATYWHRDEQIPRPFLANVHAPDGIQVTRSYPLKKEDLQDHATFHPGIHLSFGDLSGHDFWRLKARVVHERFLDEPKDAPGWSGFTVRNLYLPAKGDMPICTETCRLSFAFRPAGYLIAWDSTLMSEAADFTLGDQEEMGFAVRVATPLTVAKGKGGRIRDSEGRIDEKQVWGKQADWCDYSGPLAGKHVGLTVMPDPKNFRKSWFHARDYGLLVANPFGRNAFTKGQKSRLTVRRGESLRLRFGVLVHSHQTEKDYDIPMAYRDFLEITGSD
jgi:hypothetical protein